MMIIDNNNNDNNNNNNHNHNNNDKQINDKNTYTMEVFNLCVAKIDIILGV